MSHLLRFRMFQLSWTNPQSEVAESTIAIVPHRAHSDLFLFAITADP